MNPHGVGPEWRDMHYRIALQRGGNHLLPIRLKQARDKPRRLPDVQVELCSDFVRP